VVSEASGCVSVWRPSLGPALELRWSAHELCGEPSEVSRFMLCALVGWVWIRSVC
jgi:hypothetical protein